jgi:hypothetical protein
LRAGRRTPACCSRGREWRTRPGERCARPADIWRMPPDSIAPPPGRRTARPKLRAFGKAPPCRGAFCTDIPQRRTLQDHCIFCFPLWRRPPTVRAIPCDAVHRRSRRCAMSKSEPLLRDDLDCLRLASDLNATGEQRSECHSEGVYPASGPRLHRLGRSGWKPDIELGRQSSARSHSTRAPVLLSLASGSIPLNRG